MYMRAGGVVVLWYPPPVEVAQVSRRAVVTGPGGVAVAQVCKVGQLAGCLLSCCRVFVSVGVGSCRLVRSLIRSVAPVIGTGRALVSVGRVDTWPLGIEPPAGGIHAPQRPFRGPRLPCVGR